jgi:hypothetical protein
MSRRPGKTLTGRSRPILAMIKTVSAAPAERVVRSRLIHLVGGAGVFIDRLGIQVPTWLALVAG